MLKEAVTLFVSNVRQRIMDSLRAKEEPISSGEAVASRMFALPKPLRREVVNLKRKGS